MTKLIEIVNDCLYKSKFNIFQLYSYPTKSILPTDFYEKSVSIQGGVQEYKLLKMTPFNYLRLLNKKSITTALMQGSSQNKVYFLLKANERRSIA